MYSVCEYLCEIMLELYLHQLSLFTSDEHNPGIENRNYEIWIRIHGQRENPKIKAFFTRKIVIELRSAINA